MVEVLRNEQGNYFVRFFSLDKTHDADFIPLSDLSKFLGVGMSIVKGWYDDEIVPQRLHKEGAWLVRGIDIDDLDELERKIQEAAKIIHGMNNDEIEAIRLRRVWNLHLRKRYIQWRQEGGKPPMPLRGLVYEPNDSDSLPVRNFFVHERHMPRLSKFFAEAERLYRMFFKMLIRYARYRLKGILPVTGYRIHPVTALVLDPPEYERSMLESLPMDYYKKRIGSYLFARGRIRSKCMHPETEVAIALDAYRVIATSSIINAAGMDHEKMTCPREIPLAPRGYVMREYLPIHRLAPVPEQVLFAAVRMRKETGFEMDIDDKHFDAITFAGIRAIHWHYGESEDYSRLRSPEESELTPRRRDLLPLHRYMMMKQAAARKKVYIRGASSDDFSDPSPEMQTILQYADFAEDEFMDKYDEIDQSLNYVECGKLIEQIAGKPRLHHSQTIFAWERQFIRETSGEPLKRLFSAWVFRASDAPKNIISIRRRDTFGP